MAVKLLCLLQIFVEEFLVTFVSKNLEYSWECVRVRISIYATSGGVRIQMRCIAIAVRNKLVYGQRAIGATLLWFLDFISLRVFVCLPLVDKASDGFLHVCIQYNSIGVIFLSFIFFSFLVAPIVILEFRFFGNVPPYQYQEFLIAMVMVISHATSFKLRWKWCRRA